MLIPQSKSIIHHSKNGILSLKVLRFQKFFHQTVKLNYATNSEPTQIVTGTKNTQTSHEKKYVDYPMSNNSEYIPIALRSFSNEIKIKQLAMKNEEISDDFITFLKNNMTKKDLLSLPNFDVTLTRLMPVFVDILLRIKDDAKFVDLFTFFCYLGIKFESMDVIDKVMNVIKKGNPKIQNQLLRGSHSIKDTGINFVDQLSDEETKQLSNSYSSVLLKRIIVEVFMPLQCNYKIMEFMNILSTRNKSNHQSADLFLRLINTLQFNQAPDIDLRGKMSLIHLIDTFRIYIQDNEYIPKQLFHKFHAHILKYQLTDLRTIFNYISFFYPDGFHNLIPALQNFRSKQVPRNLMEEMERFEMINHTTHLPLNIVFVFFDHVLQQNDLNLIKAISHDLSELDVSIEYNRKLLELFKFCALKHAVHIKDIRQEIYEYLLEFTAPRGSYTLPEFEKIDILKISAVYNNDPIEIVKFFGNFKVNTIDYYSMSQADVINLFQVLKPSPFYLDKLMKCLVSCNILFDDTTFIKQWIDDDPGRCNFVITSGDDSITTSHVLEKAKYKNSTILKGLLLFKPNEMFAMLSKYNDKLAYSNQILSTLNIFRDYGIEYMVAQLSSLDLDFSKPEYYLDVLSDFMKKNNLIPAVMNNGDKFKLYDAYIRKILSINYYGGMVFACSLIPAYRSNLAILCKINESNCIDCGDLTYNSNDLEIPFEIIEKSVDYYSSFRTYTGGSWFSTYLRLCRVIEAVEDDKIRTKMFNHYFIYFQTIAIKNYSQWGIFPLYKIYSISEKFNISPDNKILFDGNDEFNAYLKENFTNLENLIEKNNHNKSKELLELLTLVSKYESNFVFNKDLLSSMFELVDEPNREYFLLLIRRLSRSIPYVENIGNFISEKYKLEPSENHCVLGIYPNQLLNDTPFFVRIKWMKFDPRYYVPFFKYCMREIITKEQRNTLKHMIENSISLIEDIDYFEDAMKFYNVYKNCTSFTATAESMNQKLNQIELAKNINDEVFVRDGKGELIIPTQIYDEFIFHYFYTNMFSYEIKDFVQLVYLLTKKDDKLGKLGFWDILKTENEIDEAIDIDPSVTELLDLVNKPKLFEKLDDSKLSSLIFLFHSSVRFHEKIPTNVLTYMIQISDNVLAIPNFNEVEKKKVLNSTFFVVAKQSDLLSTFFKKIRLIAPDYYVSISLIDELLYSFAKDDFRDIDMVIEYMLSRYDSVVAQKSWENVIKKLIDDGMNGVAQELYVKLVERKPKFKVSDVNEMMNWKQAKTPAITIDSNDGVNMKVDKFKVKLYDYDNLDKDKK